MNLDDKIAHELGSAPHKPTLRECFSRLSTLDLKLWWSRARLGGIRFRLLHFLNLSGQNTDTFAAMMGMSMPENISVSPSLRRFLLLLQFLPDFHQTLRPTSVSLKQGKAFAFTPDTEPVVRGVLKHNSQWKSQCYASPTDILSEMVLVLPSYSRTEALRATVRYWASPSLTDRVYPISTLSGPYYLTNPAVVPLSSKQESSLG